MYTETSLLGNHSLVRFTIEQVRCDMFRDCYNSQRTFQLYVEEHYTFCNQCVS